MVTFGLVLALYSTGILIILLPIIITICYKKIFKYSLYPCLIGVFTFIIFAKILEAIVHYFCIVKNNAISRTILNSVPLYVIYGASMAGIFEEFGRFFAFKFFLTKYKNRQTPISFGIGHGGIENIIVAGISFIELGFFANKVNNGTIDTYLEELKNDESQLNQIKAIVESLKSMNIFYCFLGLIERIVGTIGHICLSVFVYKGTIENNMKFVFLGVIAHIIFDISPAMYQKGVISILPTELILILLICVFVYLTKIVFFSIDIEEQKNEKDNIENISDPVLKLESEALTDGKE